MIGIDCKEREKKIHYTQIHTDGECRRSLTYMKVHIVSKKHFNSYIVLAAIQL